MRDLMKIINEATEWQDRSQGREELCIGGQIITIDVDKKSGETAGGPFYSSLDDLQGNTPDEIKADAVRKAHVEFKRQMAEFESSAKELGIDLTV